MKEILFFILGNIIALLYFSHLYFQLINAFSKRKLSIYLTFPLRFSMLSLALGALFFAYGAIAFYAIMGIMTGRFIMIYLARP
ncbi:MAG: hypothetical protein PF439_10325 [Helicobacteraceae bacterium]|jgi:hypothetical protein|nr:hypothetical protein [Helicobacteraceae bacterium]